MSAHIQVERDAYYDILESTQRSDLDVTDWLHWFLSCLNRAFERASTLLGSVLAKAQFWDQHAQTELNERQRKVLNRLLDGFEGKLTSLKYAKLAKTSQDTAGRDLADLLEKRVLPRDAGGGRSTSYSLLDQSDA